MAYLAGPDDRRQLESIVEVYDGRRASESLQLTQDFYASFHCPVQPGIRLSVWIPGYGNRAQTVGNSVFSSARGSRHNREARIIQSV